ncbi:hypothetical protein H8959_021172 [Pygathrix nigripes]
MMIIMVFNYRVAGKLNESNTWSVHNIVIICKGKKYWFSIAVVLRCCVSFNVDVKNSMTFSGPVEDMFGYTVQQYENEEGKWHQKSKQWKIEKPGLNEALM